MTKLKRAGKSIVRDIIRGRLSTESAQFILNLLMIALALFDVVMLSWLIKWVY